MIIESKGILSIDLKDKGFYDIIKKIEEHRHKMIVLMDNFYRVTVIVETAINQPLLSEKRTPLSINLISEPAYDILEQIDEHKKIISNLLDELKSLTAAVESEINQSLVAVVQPENQGSQTLQ